MKYHYLIPLLLCFFTSTAALAHNGSINGQIIDSESGKELPGVVVLLQPGKVYTTTNNLGFFSFPDLAAGNYSLTIRYLGFETKNLDQILVRDAESTTVKIELEAAILNLRDVEIVTTVSQPLQALSKLDLAIRPVSTSQDVLRVVPGLFIAQHAGGGKAEQMFLRGFDIDHGTDISLSVDGMPVNMVSHAHGQGYADLHFLIPELIENVEFKKGPYDAASGDFTTAGLVRFTTVDALDKNQIKLEGGQFNTFRAFTAFDLLGKKAARKNKHAYVAGEYFFSDGYFDQPQGFQRYNITGKYSELLDDDTKVSFTASSFYSSWDASGQVPDRAVKSGLISRFGSIDDSEGGETSRTNLNFEHIKSLKAGSLLKNQLYFSDYDFSLYSNFTFFNIDPVNGDEIHQQEHRRLIGYNGSYTLESTIANKKLDSEFGLSFRNDLSSGNELSRVKERQILLSRLALGTVNETNIGAFVSETWHLSRQFSLNAGLRYDQFRFSYEEELDSTYSVKAVNAGICSPKLNLAYDVGPKFRMYGSGGYGFHSNDSRVVVQQGGTETLPKALGFDVGGIIKPFRALFVNVAGWYLGLDQEFVYVGDEAVVEAGGRTRRFGIDVSARLQLFQSLYADWDFTYAHARSIDDPEGENFIPLAPKFTNTGGISWDAGKGFLGSLRFRHLADRPANEDNSLIAKGYFLLDAVVGYKVNSFTISLNAQNLTNTGWNEAQFETESRLQFEQEPVTEIHFTPGSPFFLKASIAYRF
ncbi:MAG: TonB-dependent receptor [Saprospiraceae bacterium]